MPRPLPNIPRGPRRRVAPPADYLLACPRISPQWELGALQALIKPQTKGSILHRPALQRWPRHATTAVADVARHVKEALGFVAEPVLAADGDYHFFIKAAAAELESLKAFAVLLSRQVPEPWFVLGRLFIRGGHFFRRERGRKLNLVPAANVHLSRGMWAALRQARQNSALELSTGD